MITHLSVALLAGLALGLVSDQDLARKGEEEFREGVRLKDDDTEARPRFRAAAGAYEELRRRGVRNPLLYRNLGNAWFLAGDLPRAILAYRCGLQLAPGDRALRANLTVAREEVVYPDGTAFGRPPEATRPPWLPYLEGPWVFALAVGSYVLAWVCIARWFVVRRGRPLLVGLLCLVGAAVLTAALVTQTEGTPPGPVAVLAEDGVFLRRGNGLKYPPRYDTPLPRGAEARPLCVRGEWVQIELPGGEVGWVLRRYVVLAEPVPEQPEQSGRPNPDRGGISLAFRAVFCKSTQRLAFRDAPVYSVAK